MGEDTRQRMTVAELVEPTEVTVRTRDRPEPNAGEVLIAVSRVGICGSDLHWYEHGQMGSRTVDEPLILGHESAGEVVAVGEDVSEFSPGDRVAIEPGIPCGECGHCRQGDYNLCPNVEFMSTPGTDGALREYLTWPTEFVHPVSESLTLTEAALCEPLSVGFQAVRRGDVDVGDSVLIMGAGPIGRMVQECAIAAGTSEVIVADLVEEKLDRAVERGADLAIDSGTQDVSEVIEAEVPSGVDVAIDATGAAPAIEGLPSTVASGGTVVLVGLADSQAIPFDTYRLVRKQIDIRGSYRFANTYPTVIDLLDSDKISIENMVDFHAPLEEIENAFERAAESDVIKGVVDIG